MQNYLCETGVAAAVGDPDDEKVFSRRNRIDVQTELFIRRIENAIHRSDGRPRTRVERIFGAA